jgi:sugar phosphate isomerase/epimerase
VAVELGLTPDNRWDVASIDLVAAVSAAGFGALGTSAERVDPATVDAFRQAGIRCHEILALVLSDDAAATVARAERLTEAADAIGASWVLTVFRAPLTAATATTIQTCAGLFAEAGAGMAVEFSPLGPVSSIPKGLEIVRTANAGSGRAGLMIDSWHFSFGDSTWDDLATVRPEDIAYVQFTDALWAESDDLFYETMNRRAVPGDGVLELERFSSTLLDSGFDGVVSAEVLSSGLREQPVPEVIRALHLAMVRYWR